MLCTLLILIIKRPLIKWLPFSNLTSGSDSNIAIETITVTITITVTVTIAVSDSYNCSQLSLQLQFQLQSVQPTKKKRLAGNKQQRET